MIRLYLSLLPPLSLSLTVGPSHTKLLAGLQHIWIHKNGNLESRDMIQLIFLESTGREKRLIVL